MYPPYSHYKVILATEDQLRCAHFQLRYMVYCQKKNYEPSSLFPDGHEYDDYDRHALHLLLKYTPPGSQRDQNVGTIRLIKGENGTLPIEHISKLNKKELTNKYSGELSRLAIHEAPSGHDTLPLFILCQAAQHHARRCGISRLYFLARPALARHLTRNYLPFEQAGSPCYHRGHRIPYGMDVKGFALGLARWEKKLINQNLIPSTTPENLHACRTTNRFYEKIPEACLQAKETPQTERVI